jgi:phage FluMu protein Com
MPIKFQCPHCQKRLSVADGMGGKRGKCPSCQQPFVIPAAGEATTVANGQTAAGETARRPAAKSAAPAGPPGLTQAEAEALAAEALSDKKEEPAPAAAEPQTIKFDCTYCGHAIEVGADMAGKRIPCPDPECRRIVKVPEIVKRAPKEWHKDAPQVPVPEGAWETKATTSTVTEEDLDETDLLPDEEDETVLGKSLRTAARIPPFLFPLRLPFYGFVYAVLWWRKSGKYVRAATVLLLLGVIGGGVYAGMSWWNRGKADRFAKAARDYAAAGDPAVKQVGQPGVAVLYAHLGDYTRRRQRPGAAAAARADFDKALAALQRAPGSAADDRDTVLTDLALLSVELGSDDRELLDAGKAEKWDNVQRSLHTTLMAIRNPGARAFALRAVCRRLTALKHPERARALALQVNEVGPAEEAAPNNDKGPVVLGGPPADANKQDKGRDQRRAEELAARADSLAQVGLDLLAFDPKTPDKEKEQRRAAAEELAKRALAFKPKADDPAPVTPALVALCLVLDKPKEFPPPKAPPIKEDEEAKNAEERARQDEARRLAEAVAEREAVGKVAALARTGKLDQARAAVKGSPEQRLAMLLAVAEASADANPADKADVEAAARAVEARKGGTGFAWSALRVIELGERVKLDDERLDAVANAVGERDLRARAQLAALRVKLARSKKPFEEDAAKAVAFEGDKARGVCHYAARLELARHNTRDSGGWAKAVDAWPDDQKAFGKLGAALGLIGD